MKFSIRWRDSVMQRGTFRECKSLDEARAWAAANISYPCSIVEDDDFSLDEIFGGNPEAKENVNCDLEFMRRIR